MKTSLIIIVLLIIAVGGYAIMTKDSPSSPDEIPLDEGRIVAPADVALPVGQTATLVGVAITLNEVTTDSRCPEGVQCVWAGEVVASITLQSGSNTGTVPITLGASPTEFSGYLVSLVAALPIPKEGTTIEEGDYMLTFHIAPVN